MSTRIKGNKLGLTVGGVNYWCDATAVVLDNEESDSDVTTFCDAAQGGSRQWFFTITAIQSTQTTSFWRYLWAHTGDEVAFVYAVHGNEVATADEPHLVGTLKVGPKPSLGGEAGTTSTYTFETRLDVDEQPTLDDGTVAVPLVQAVTPETAAAGTQVVISGSRFSEATGVKFGTTNATSFVAVSDATITAVVPSGTGSKPITVINADGTSTALDFTVS